MSNRYTICKHFSRPKPDVKIDGAQNVFNVCACLHIKSSYSEIGYGKERPLNIKKTQWTELCIIAGRSICIGTPDVMKSIGENYRTLPMFEKSLHEYVHKKFYSLESNELLKCRWNEYKRAFTDRVFAPFQFIDMRDYHFYNCRNRFIPAESVHKRGGYRMVLKPGPGVDFIGEIPIPQEMMMKRPKPKAKKQKKPPNTGPHNENNRNVLNSHLS